jgi:hypothetical protein
MSSVYKYITEYCSSDTKSVDRLIISAFLHINNIRPKNNKLLKSHLITNTSSEEFTRLSNFIELINKENTKLDFEQLIQLFEFVISPSDRIINGAIYTPRYIRKYIISETLGKIDIIKSNYKLADISCGCGGFIFDASIEINNKTDISFSDIYKKHIFGLDIQNYSVIRTKLLLSLLALVNGEDRKAFHFNIYQGDSLDFQWKSKIKNFKGFDTIIGNPPYVCARNLDLETREKLKLWEVCKSGNTDLYIPFFQIGIENLTKNGILGYITMNSFFKSLNGRELRTYFEKNELNLKIIDFGSEQVFRSKNTYTCICFIEKNCNSFIEYTNTKSTQITNRKAYEKILYKNLESRKGWNLNNNTVINKIERTGVPFRDRYKTRHGIATLKNNIYIFRPVKEDDKFYYLQNGDLYKIEKQICRDIVNSNKLSRQKKLSDLRERVIFPYDNQLKPKLLNEDILKKDYPEAYKYLRQKKNILDKRDKGNGNYDQWFAFGRTQSLEKIQTKMFFPKYSDKTPHFIINSDENLLFYNGLAVVGSSIKEMKILKKIMESSVFWYYIQSTSKPYSSNYYSLNGNYIRNFGICDLNEKEIRFILLEKKQDVLNEFFEDKYGISIK